MSDIFDNENLEFHELIGEGGFGQVYRVTFKNPYKGFSQAAAKTVLSLRDEEVDIMRKLYHPNIVTWIAFYKQSQPTTYVIIIEYAKEGSLYDYLKKKENPLSDELKLKWSKESALAVHYLHVCNCLHRDIKSQNCLIFEGNVLKLCDFGLAREIDRSHTMSSQKGSFQHMAPEIIKTNDEGHSTYSKYTDVYAYGMLVVEIFKRKAPFHGEEYGFVVYHVGQGLLKPDIPSDCPQFLADVISRCWEYDPKKRHTMDMIIGEFANHEPNIKTVKPDKASTMQVTSFVLKNQEDQTFMADRVRCCPNGSLVVATYRESSIGIFQEGNLGKHVPKQVFVDNPTEGAEQIGRIRSIDVSKEGHILIVDGTRYVKVFTQDGTHMQSLLVSEEKSEKYANLRCVTIDQHGRVLILDRDGNLIVLRSCFQNDIVNELNCKLEPTGRITVNKKNQVIYHVGPYGEKFTKLVCLDVESGNRIFESQIKIVDNNIEEGNKVWAEGVVCDPDDNIYVLVKVLQGLDEIEYSGQLHKYDSSGKFVECLVKGIKSPWDLDIKPDGSLVVANHDSIEIYNP